MADENFEKKPHIDAEILGKVAEDKKEAVVDQTDAAHSEARRQQAVRQAETQKKVGIKTYRDYAAQELKKGGGTLTRMIIQEREKEREQKRHSVKNTKNIAISFLAVLFVLAGIGIIVLSFILVNRQQEAAEERNSFIVAPSPLVISDFRKELYIAAPSRARIVREVQDEIENTTIPVGSVKHIYFVQDGTNDPKELITASGFMRDMDTQMPETLLRTIEPIFMYGVYSSTEVSPFLIFKVSSYNTAYSGMLEWEDNIVRNLDDLFTQDLSDTSRLVFQDVVLYNTDVRVLLDERGEVLFGYGFLQDKVTLVIFDNRLTLREIITRTQNNTIRQ